jgi:cephalosporin hydroxylase
MLPYITEAGFDEALGELIKLHDIGGIYTPNPVAWAYLNKSLPLIAPGIALVNASPAQEELTSYRTASKLGRQLLTQTLSLASRVSAKPAMLEVQLSALVRHANVIPGMCDDEKIGALCEVARYSVPGDIVEIGSAYGKSAFVLSRLARVYGIGKTLCIDPWKREYMVQNDAGGLVDDSLQYFDSDETLRVFEMNLLPYSNGDLNYMRLPSTEAAVLYAAQRTASTESFGTTEYSGKIALLHIDGNHSYEAARADIEVWSGHVLPGGWIIIDDYVWPYGDGPQRVGDEFLIENKDRISCGFVMGTALFLQLY